MNNDNEKFKEGFEDGGTQDQRLKKQRADIARIFKRREELLANKHAGNLDKLIDRGSILERTANNRPTLFTSVPQSYEVTFPDEFYFQIYRLNGWDTSGDKIKNRPGIVGRWTNWLIYVNYPVGTIKWLRENSPSDGYGNRPYKFFQFLTGSGKIQLLEFIESAIDLMKKCRNWDQFKRLLAKGYGKTYQPDMFDKDDIDWKPKK